MVDRSKKVGKQYRNPVPTRVGGLDVALKVLPQMLFGRSAGEPKEPLGPFATDATVYATSPVSGLRVTWFGHSALLVEIDGTRVLIDPVWERCAGPFGWMGPKRFFPPTLALEQMPKLDAVLISHDHYDHLGAATVAALGSLQPALRWITHLGVGAELQRFGIAEKRITELDWTGSAEVAGLKVTSWPTRHFSGRRANRFGTLWGSFVLEGPRRSVYYGADTGPWDGFAELGKRYPRLDLVMLEVGASSPYWPEIHLGPDAAVAAYEAMGSPGMLMPVHWGLFNLALHGWRQPIERVGELANERGLRVWSPEPGMPTEVVASQAIRSAWWHGKQ